MAILASKQDRCIMGLKAPGTLSSLGSTITVNPLIGEMYSGVERDHVLARLHGHSEPLDR